MAHFESDTELYDELGGIFRNLLGNAERLDRLRHADAIVQFSFEQPTARVTFDARAGHDPRLDLGETELRPDVVLAMDADTGRALLTGEVNAMVAFARGDVRAKGPAVKVLRLVPATVGAHQVETDAPLPAEPAAEVETPAEVEAAAPEAPAEPAES